MIIIGYRKITDNSIDPCPWPLLSCDPRRLLVEAASSTTCAAPVCEVADTPPLSVVYPTYLVRSSFPPVSLDSPKDIR